MKLQLNPFLILIIATIHFFSCSEDASSPVENTTSDLITLEYVVDFGNQGNASDLEVKYSVKDASSLSELWLFIAPEADFLKINSNSLSNLSQERYQKITISSSAVEIRPSASLLDTEGNQINGGTAYRLGFATVKEGTISKEIIVYTFELRDQHYLTGRYVGIWKDETGSYDLSFEIAEVGNALRGPVYSSNNFVSHWGSQDDGNILIEVMGDNLVNIEYNEFQSGLMNGCEGKWTGSGTIVDLVTLHMKFQGKNCLYSSSNAQVELERFE